MILIEKQIKTDHQFVPWIAPLSPIQWAQLTISIRQRAPVRLTSVISYASSLPTI